MKLALRAVRILSSGFRMTGLALKLYGSACHWVIATSTENETNYFLSSTFEMKLTIRIIISMCTYPNVTVNRACPNRVGLHSLTSANQLSRVSITQRSCTDA